MSASVNKRKLAFKILTPVATLLALCGIFLLINFLFIDNCLIIEEESNIRFGLTEEQRREFYKEITHAEEFASKAAKKEFPIPTTMPDPEAKKQLDFDDELLEKLKDDLCKEF